MPNITGAFSTYGGNISAAEGVFERGSAMGNVGVYTGGRMPAWIYFDASCSSVIYGASETVTPVSISTKLILKY